MTSTSSHDSQHYDTQYNDTNFTNNNAAFSITTLVVVLRAEHTLSLIMLSVSTFTILFLRI
jgi:hypothetical protein